MATSTKAEASVEKGTDAKEEVQKEVPGQSAP